VVLPAEDIGKPITEVMSRAPVMLPDTALASDAALAMARHGIRHVVVTRNSHLAGVISEKDLFALQRVGLTQISIDIRNSDSLESLQQCGRDISQLAHNMLAQGVGTEQLTQIISTLNDQLTIRIIELATQAAGITQIDFCWIALGSEGRIEQTLSTDQDNGIIFVDPADNNLVTVRAALLPVALEINRMLDVCGFPLCKGNIMASNPAWCLSLSEWKAQFTEWIDQGDPAALLNAAIFFDFRPLHGNASLAGELRDWLGAHARGNPRFLHQMAANALRNRPPLGVVRDFVVPGSGEHAHTIDLKLNGTSPFVDAARIFSLAAGVGATNTVQRLQQAAPVLNLPKTELAAWTESFQYIQMLRLRHQHLERDAGHAGDNYVNPDDLSELDRRILKEAFRQARKLQARLAMDYGL
jgi:CBS domain-containing protein